ncbi:MAG: nicotinate (nicotinamide) nucleotide adenylyltransferase [Chlamydiota bacterium]
MAKKKVGFFGGTFDPIHFGHLNLALQIREQCGLDEILFSPAQVSPTKQQYPPHAIAKHRLNMLMLALEGMAQVKIYDQELFRPPPSYTVDTMQELLKEEKEAQFYLILGQDTACSLGQWKGIEELIRLAPPLIGTRFGIKDKNLTGIPEAILREVERGVCSIAAMDISATKIRKRLKNHLYCHHLVPAKVLDYIYQNELYL